MVAIRKEKWTADEYLEFERTSEEKHEFLDGKIYLMAGASRRHNLVVFNVATTLGTQLKGSVCEAYINDMRVKVGQRRYFYPDISVVCSKPEFEDKHVDTLLNPTLVIEVLSPSTQDFDRTEKFEAYRALASLQEYVLITPYEPRIECYHRQGEGKWLFSDVKGLDDSLELPSIGCTLTLADVYDKVTFEE